MDPGRLTCYLQIITFVGPVILPSLGLTSQHDSGEGGLPGHLLAFPLLNH